MDYTTNPRYRRAGATTSLPQSYAPFKGTVEQALKYAEQNGLIVHHFQGVAPRGYEIIALVPEITGQEVASE